MNGWGMQFFEEKGEKKRESEKKKAQRKREKWSHWVPKSRTTQKKDTQPIVQISCEPKQQFGPTNPFLVRTIGAHRGALLRRRGSRGTRAQEKCLKVIRGTMRKLDPKGLLEGLVGESADKRNMKIGSTTNEKKCPAQEKDRTKPNGRSLVLRDVGRGRNEMKSLNDCIDQSGVWSWR